MENNYLPSWINQLNMTVRNNSEAGFFISVGIAGALFLYLFSCQLYYYFTEKKIIQIELFCLFFPLSLLVLTLGFCLYLAPVDAPVLNAGLFIQSIGMMVYAVSFFFITGPFRYMYKGPVNRLAFFLCVCLVLGALPLLGNFSPRFILGPLCIVLSFPYIPYIRRAPAPARGGSNFFYKRLERFCRAVEDVLYSSVVTTPGPRTRGLLLFNSYRVKKRGNSRKDFLYAALILLFIGISLILSWRLPLCAGILLGAIFYHRKNIVRLEAVAPQVREDVPEDIGRSTVNTVTTGITQKLPVKTGAVLKPETGGDAEKNQGGSQKKWQKKRRRRKNRKISTASGGKTVNVTEKTLETGGKPTAQVGKIEKVSAKPREATDNVETVLAKAIESILMIEKTALKSIEPAAKTENIEKTLAKIKESIENIQKAAAQTVEFIGKIERTQEKAVTEGEEARSSEGSGELRNFAGERPDIRREAGETDAADVQALEEVVLPVKEDERVSYLLNPFIPREFLNILHKNTALDLKLGDHIKQEMTIFFSDIRDFTTLSEDLTPEESFKFINSYLTRIVPVIEKHGGFVDKYIGDAILALYPQTNGADMAVQTAIEIQGKLLEYNLHRANSGYRPLAMGIGLHTGPLMLGVVGVSGRMQNTVISDAVNLASRLESMTKAFNISMAISEQTFKRLEDPGSYMYRFIGQVRVKGKAEPVSVYEILNGISPEIMDKKMKANRFFEEGMLSFKQKYYSDAKEHFEKVLEILPDDGASIFYKEYCDAKIAATSNISETAV